MLINTFICEVFQAYQRMFGHTQLGIPHDTNLAALMIKHPLLSRQFFNKTFLWSNIQERKLLTHSYVIFFRSLIFFILFFWGGECYNSS